MQMKLSELPDLYSETNRTLFLTIALILLAGIAFTDRFILPGTDLGFLYIFPILLAAGFLGRWQMVALCLFCVIMREVLGSYPIVFSGYRMLRGMTDFTAAGLFVGELTRNRQMAVTHLKEIQEETRLRREVEKELQVVVERSPAAILTVDSRGKVLLANAAAHRMLALEQGRLEGKGINHYLPVLGSIQENTNNGGFLHTEMESTGWRQSGEIFRAHIWLSSYAVGSESRLAVVAVDASEELRDREESGLHRLLSNSRVLVGAVAHEVRNLCGAIAVAHANLMRLPGMVENQDFRALGNLLEGLRKLASAELRPFVETPLAGVALKPIFDDLGIVIEASFRQADARVVWEIPATLPLVWADAQGLLQVFLNLAQNAQREIHKSRSKVLTISAGLETDSVVVRFADNGPGVGHPERLFQPFQEGAQSTGLGLYVSRAIMRSLGGDLRYEPANPGACFIVELMRADREGKA
jgi:two-component system sensor kinase FixL